MEKCRPDWVLHNIVTGEFRVADPELAMMLLLGGLRTVLRFGPRPRPPRLADRVVDALLQGSAPAIRSAEPDTW